MTRAILAKENYKKSDWQNKDVHDTHFTTRENTEYNMEKLFGENTEKVVGKMKEIINMSSELFVPTAWSENQKAFEIFGYDFLIDKDYNVYLLEVNDKSGLAYEIEPLFNKVIEITERLMK